MTDETIAISQIHGQFTTAACTALKEMREDLEYQIAQSSTGLAHPGVIQDMLLKTLGILIVLEESKVFAENHRHRLP